MNDAMNIFELYTESVEQPQMHVNEHGTKIWSLKSGTMHRDDGPAVVFPDGSKQWRRLNALHRTDGPAVENADGSKQWWIDGRKYDDLTQWAKWALKYEGKECTKEMIEQKIQSVMQQDLFD